MYYLSLEQKQELWNELLISNRILVKNGDDPNKVQDSVLWNYFLFKDCISLPPTGEAPVFSAKVAEYKEAWEKFKPTMVDTSKTFTIKDK